MIGARKCGSKVQIEVYDTGIGIPKDKIEDVFKEFERIGVNDEVGLGLGLSIVQRTAKLLGAEVKLKSILGRGSRFTLSIAKHSDIQIKAENNKLSQKLDGPEKKKSRAKASKTKIDNKKKFLIVDDDASVRDAMVALLAAVDYQCEAIGSFEEAIEVFDNNPKGYEGFLLDYDLCSNKDGLDLAIHIKNTEPAARIAIITAHDFDEFSHKAIVSSLTLMRKPIVPTDLIDWMESN